jgi:hypothetical protein
LKQDYHETELMKLGKAINDHRSMVAGHCALGEPSPEGHGEIMRSGKDLADSMRDIADKLCPPPTANAVTNSNLSMTSTAGSARKGFSMFAQFQVEGFREICNRLKNANAALDAAVGVYEKPAAQNNVTGKILEDAISSLQDELVTCSAMLAKYGAGIKSMSRHVPGEDDPRMSPETRDACQRMQARAAGKAVTAPVSGSVL